MNTIQETVKDLRDLPPAHVRMVHNLILSLKRTVKGARSKKAPCYAYRKARRAFAAYKGSLSDDITALREDRL
jgi:hypothetical protein